MEKKTKSPFATRTKKKQIILIHLTINELRAALIACDNYVGSLRKHPKLQLRAAAELKRKFISAELYK